MTKPSPELAALFAPVLAWLDAGGHDQDKDLGFNMSSFIMTTTDNKAAYDFARNPCGTTCCIAGAVGMFNDLDYTKVFTASTEISSYRRSTFADHALVMNHGMTIWDAEALFYRISSDIRPAHAAAVVRHWIETGDVDWDIPFVDPSLPTE